MTVEVITSPETQQHAGGGFEGASRISQQLAMWTAPIRSADAELLPEKDTIDGRTMDLQRNDGYIHGAIQHQKDSIVGAFYRLNLQPNYKYLGLDETWASEFQEAVENTFTLAAESPECWFDASGKLTFSEMVRLALGVSMVAGENLATAEWIREVQRPFKTAIQLVDPVRLGNPPGLSAFDGWRKGVKVSRYGEALKFAIRKSLPGDTWMMADQYQYAIVDARKPWGRKQVLHHFEPYRIDQSRGVSEMVSILKQTKMVGKYQDVVLANAVLNATYAAVLESDLPPADAFEAIGATNDPMNAWAANYLAAVAAYQKGGRNIHIDGVKIPALYPGTKFKLQNAGQPGGVGTNFEESLLRHLAAGFGMSYEEFAHDFTKTNYSSARAAMGETWKRQQGKKKATADRFANDILLLWFEEQFNAGAFKDVLPRNAPNFYEGLNKEAYTCCKWIGAPRGQIDELKETNAAIARIAAGISTYEKECARFGDDFREVFQQRMREQKMIAEMGLTLNLAGAGKPGGDQKSGKQDSEQGDTNDSEND